MTKSPHQFPPYEAATTKDGNPELTIIAVTQGKRQGRKTGQRVLGRAAKDMPVGALAFTVSEDARHKYKPFSKLRGDVYKRYAKNGNYNYKNWPQAIKDYLDPTRTDVLIGNSEQQRQLQRRN